MNPNTIPIHKGHVRPANIRVQVPRCDRVAKADAICRLVSAESGYSVKELLGRDRPDPLTRARAVAIYLCVLWSGLNTSELGEYWGRSRRTIQWHRDGVLERIFVEHKTQMQVERLTAIIQKSK